jgi:hypothetical protein
MRKKVLKTSSGQTDEQAGSKLIVCFCKAGREKMGKLKFI